MRKLGHLAPQLCIIAVEPLLYRFQQKIRKENRAVREL